VSPAAPELTDEAVTGPAVDQPVPARGIGGRGERVPPFRIRLDDFDGPFDLLLGLIASHSLDVTRLALATVTDDFLTHLRALSAAGGFDLDQASEFVVVAATLLDLKAARLLPRGEVEDADDVAALEAHDLLFARLLQYRAYKEVAGVLAGRFAAAALRFPAAVGPGGLGDVVPEVLLGITPQRFAEIAARVCAPRPEPLVSLAHLHAPPVSVAEQSTLLRTRLRGVGTATFTVLTADAPDLATVVARFLALLELFRDGLVTFEQDSPMAELTVHWTPA
jgi:segregation and condensation protein A